MILAETLSSVKPANSVSGPVIGAQLHCIKVDMVAALTDEDREMVDLLIINYTQQVQALQSWFPEWCW